MGLRGSVTLISLWNFNPIDLHISSSNNRVALLSLFPRTIFLKKTEQALAKEVIDRKNCSLSESGVNCIRQPSIANWSSSIVSRILSGLSLCRPVTGPPGKLVNWMAGIGLTSLRSSTTSLKQFYLLSVIDGSIVHFVLPYPPPLKCTLSFLLWSAPKSPFPPHLVYSICQQKSAPKPSLL